MMEVPDDARTHAGRAVPSPHKDLEGQNSQTCDFLAPCTKPKFHILQTCVIALWADQGAGDTPPSREKAPLHHATQSTAVQ